MMAAILNSAILDSDPWYLFSDSLKNTLTPLWLWKTNSIWLKLPSHLTWWWLLTPSLILPSSIQILHLTQTISICKLLHSHSTWWWQPSWICPSWIQPFCTKKNFSHSFWLNLMMAAILNSWQLEFHHLGFSHLSISSQTHSHLPRLVPTICTKNSLTFWLNFIGLNSAILDSAILHKTLTQTNSLNHSFILMINLEFCYGSTILPKKTSLIHSDSTGWWWHLELPSWIQPFYTKYFTYSSDSTWWWQPSSIWPLNSAILVLSNSPTLAIAHHFQKKKLHSLTHKIHSLIQSDLMMAAILNSAILDSAILNKTLTQTHSIWLKLLHSHLMMAAIFN